MTLQAIRLDLTEKQAYSRSHGGMGEIKSYIRLMKPGVMSLAIFSGFAGMCLGITDIGSFALLTTADVCRLTWGFLALIMGAGASGALNMAFEIDIDAKMPRTSRRPLPANQLTKASALEFGYTLAFLGVFLMGMMVNALSAALLGSVIFLYVYVYTLLLKPRSVHSVVIGGIPGALPPVIGYSIVQGSLSCASFSIFLIIFLWIPPHSWALALFREADYKSANIPTLPAVKGRASAVRQILLYSLAMILSTYVAGILVKAGMFYYISATILNALFAKYAFGLLGSSQISWLGRAKKPMTRVEEIPYLEGQKPEKALFIYSINYLLILLVVLIFQEIF